MIKMSNSNGKSCFTSEISKVLAQPVKEVPPRLRRVVVKDAKVKVIEFNNGDRQFRIDTLIRYKDVQSTKWWPRKFRLDKPEGKIIRDFIAQEEELGLNVFDGKTIYEVLFAKDEDNFNEWRSIKRLDCKEAA